MFVLLFLDVDIRFQLQDPDVPTMLGISWTWIGLDRIYFFSDLLPNFLQFLASSIL